MSFRLAWDLPYPDVFEESDSHNQAIRQYFREISKSWFCFQAIPISIYFSKAQNKFHASHKSAVNAETRFSSELVYVANQ